MSVLQRRLTWGSVSQGRRSNPTFAFSAKQLGTLHNPKNLAAFLQYGGIGGLAKGLHTSATKGIGCEPEDTAVVHPPGEGQARSGTHSTDASSPTLLEGEFRTPRRAAFLDNRLPTKKQPSFPHLVWGAYNDPVLFLLTAAAAVSLAIGLYQTFSLVHTVSNPPVEWVEGVAILVAVVIVVLAGLVNDWEKQRQFRKLNQKQLERDVRVVRLGSSRLMPSSEVLVGDIIHLEPGDVVPADGVLVDGHKVMCDESIATGESELVHKTPGDAALQALRGQRGQPEPELLPGRDVFMLSGTKVMEGVGTFLVTATGVNSTYGKILASLKEDDQPTPLQARLSVLAKYISWTGGVIATLLFLALFIRFLATLPHDSRLPAEKGKSFVDIVIISLTVLVIAVPEGLPLAVTLSLAYATTRMLKDHNLVRQLKSCEIMGNATNICSDKTGTLTQNKMTVVVGTVGKTLEFQDKSSDVTKADTKDGSFVGSNTESALLNFAKSYLDMAQVDLERSKQKIVQLIPFNSSRQCMAVVLQLPSSDMYRVFVKGAPEVLLSKCNSVITNPASGIASTELRPGDREHISSTIARYADQALRTISLAYRDFQHDPTADGAEGRLSATKPDFTLHFLLQDLVFLGLMGIRDPLRPGVADSVHTCQRAGVTVRMVTGDNLHTAKAIAKQCGIMSGDGSDVAMEGVAFRALDDSGMDRVVPSLKVIARSTPGDKRKLVIYLRAKGEIVAVTGDGTNDASAMSAADVSFSMGGVEGTEVAREASSIILLTDDFTCIVRAIMWGRAVNDSVKKFLQFQITITVTSVVLAFVSAISNSSEESVLTPVQLMWINLFQDTLAALALATDRPQKRVLDREPEARTAPLINIPMWKTISGQSLYQLTVTFVLYFAGPRIFPYGTEDEVQQVETLVFNAYVCMQIGNMYNCRQYDNTFNIFEGMFSNWLFMSITTIMIGVQILIVFVGGQAFAVVPLTGVQWAVSLVLGLLSLVVGALIRCLPDEPFQRLANGVIPTKWRSGAEQRVAPVDED
ncbi:calcium-translocating P-type ATPase [Thozetella sp. PMI_491]|nr:calcium-translocating P-type ATPase [Thozetella sp. PMI_491]